MENPIKMDDLGVPLFLETPIYTQLTCFFLGGGLTVTILWDKSFKYMGSVGF